MRRLLLIVAVVFAAVLPAAKASALVTVDGRYWFTNLSDSVQVSSGGIAGTNINLVNDLGVDDKKNFWEARVALELGSHKLRYAFMPLKWTGSQTLTQTITFAGQTYSASSDVDTELKLNYHRFGYEYDIFDLLNNKLGVIFEVKYFEGRASLTSAGVTQTKSVKVPLPAIGVTGQVGLPFLLSVGGEVTGLTIGKKAYLVDAEAGVNFKPAPFVIISGGYRVFKLHLEDNGDKADLTLAGPFVNLRADF